MAGDTVVTGIAEREVAVAAAHALKQTMERYNLPGTVAISFGPAEEQLISRPFLVRAGYFKDADAAILVHIADNMRTTFGYRNYAAISAKFTFHGKTAHGAVAPGRERRDGEHPRQRQVEDQREDRCVSHCATSRRGSPACRRARGTRTCGGFRSARATDAPRRAAPPPTRVGPP